MVQVCWAGHPNVEPSHASSPPQSRWHTPSAQASREGSSRETGAEELPTIVQGFVDCMMMKMSNIFYTTLNHTIKIWSRFIETTRVHIVFESVDLHSIASYFLNGSVGGFFSGVTQNQILFSVIRFPFLG